MWEDSDPCRLDFVSSKTYSGHTDIFPSMSCY
jgi:hypothetical protein